MKIEKKEIKVRDILDGFKENPEDDSVVGYHGQLDIRPPYQRAFVYDDKQQQEVFNTVMNGFPLNTMYWAKTPKGYEVLDGQQRTLSILDYITKPIAWTYLDQPHTFGSLKKEERNQILDYKLDIYICDGNEREKLEWFRVVNIAGEKLTDQELRNSIYVGSWLYNAKRYFSKVNGAGEALGSPYIKGVANRQEILEEVLKWISQKQGISIEEYMSLHQFDENSKELEEYFETVINWANETFPKKDRNKRGLNWGELYEKYHNNEYDVDDFSKQIDILLKDDEIKRKPGIYEYLLSGDERHLNLRTFSKSDKESAYYRANKKCENCGREITIEEAQADHIIPWSQGGKTETSNLQILCRDCNLKKG